MESTAIPHSEARDVDVMGARVLATLIDAVVISLLAFAAYVPFMILGAILASASDAMAVLGALLMVVGVIAAIAAPFLYYILMEGKRGQTVGKMMTGIEVVREDGGGLPGTKAATIRTLLRIVDGLFAYLVGFLVANSSDMHQRLGDKAAHTIVVRKGARG